MSHPMQKTCLGITPIQQAEIEAMYDGGGPPYTFREVLLSHERLRHELADRERLLDSGAAKIARLEAEVRSMKEELIDMYSDSLANIGSVLEDGWIDSCCMSSAVYAGNKLVELGVYERDEKRGGGRRQFYRRIANES